MPAKIISRIWVFQSESDPQKTYQTLEYSDGTTSCECRGWIYKKKTTPDGQRSCKHTRFVDTGTARQHAITVKDYNNAQAKVEAVRFTSQTGTPVLAERVARVIELEEA